MGGFIMSTTAVTEPTLVSPGATASRPPHYRFTVAQFDQLLRDGTIGPQERVELIDGLVVSKMPENPPHIAVGKLLQDALRAVLPPGWHVSKEDDVVITDYDRPQPDLAVVRGAARDYLNRYATPADIGLGVEISDSTLASDRSVKMPRYAAARIPIDWIVNLVDGHVEVYTDPAGDSYNHCEIFKRGDEIPVVIDGKPVGQIAVSEILP